MVRDCLMLNSNIVAACERECKKLREELEGSGRRELADGVVTVFSMNCSGHMCVLGMKPLLKFYDGLSSFVVRVGHLCQSARSSDKYESALENEIRRKFRFRVVVDDELPAAFHRWQAHAKFILDLTGVDVSQETKDAILLFDNGDWESDDLVHWCRPSCSCGRSRAIALSGFISAAKASIGPNCPLALEYRWKHMEKANA
eukprot:8886157-Pyramimonas_sp.AAC.1